MISMTISSILRPYFELFMKKILTKEFHISSSQRRAVLLNGRSVAHEIHSELKLEVGAMVSAGHPAPHLALVRVGSDPASSTYLKNKAIAANQIGVVSTSHQLPESITQSSLLQLLQQLNLDPDVHGILVQLPLPPHIGEKVVCNAIHPSKDVDGFHETNIGRFCLDVPCMGPCTPLGVVELLRRYSISCHGARAVVCGRSKNVGLPIALLLHGDGIREDGAVGGLDCSTTICHRYTPAADLQYYLSTADIVVSAAGVPNLIRGEHLKPGCAVVDVAINRVKDDVTGKTKLVGDCHFQSCVEVAGHISPVPGGVGPLTVAMLMKNTVQAAQQQQQLRRPAAAAQ